jgi:hypothetical protein
MKKTLLQLTYLFTILFLLSCRKGDDGTPGPAGQDALTQQGKISGTITTLDASSNVTTIPFEFNYYESIASNTYQDYKPGTGYIYAIKRRDLKEPQSFMSMSYNGNIPYASTNPEYMTFDFSIIVKKADGSYAVLQDNYCPSSCNDYVNLAPLNPATGAPQATVNYSNYSFDYTTGVMKFDFTINLPSGYTNFNGTVAIAGTVDVVLNKKTSL